MEEWETRRQFSLMSKKNGESDYEHMIIYLKELKQRKILSSFNHAAKPIWLSSERHKKYIFEEYFACYLLYSES